jgi:hypothetical protein
MNAIQPLPIEIEPRPCAQCGLTIDRHQMVDDGEGPEFFCANIPLDELERRAELRREEEMAAMLMQWELADPRDRWRHTGEPKPVIPPDLARQEPYAPPQSTVDAFWVVLDRGDPQALAAWLADHPLDGSHLHQLWRAKCSTAAA